MLRGYRRQPVAAWLGGEGFIVRDTFTDTDSVSLASHTPDTDTVGTGWVVNAGTWEIQGNRVRKTATNAHQTAHIDAGVTDYTAKITFRGATDGGLSRVGIYARVAAGASMDGYHIYAEDSLTTKNLALHVWAAGAPTELDKVIGATWTAGDVLTVTVSGTTITGTINGSTVTTAAASRNSASTLVGLHAFDATSELDDFEVTA